MQSYNVNRLKTQRFQDDSPRIFLKLLRRTDAVTRLNIEVFLAYIGMKVAQTNPRVAPGDVNNMRSKSLLCP